MKIIAIIEDDPHIGGILERTLAREGYGRSGHIQVRRRSTFFPNIRRT